MKTQLTTLHNVIDTSEMKTNQPLNTRIKTLSLVPVLLAGLVLMPAGPLTAQTFTTLHAFSASGNNPSNWVNSDGAFPWGTLILSSNRLYGTAASGGSSGDGTVFAINTDGTGFTNLYNFTATSTNSSSVFTNTDGALPLAGLILSGNTLYGTTAEGGSSGVGTVFAVSTDGTGFKTLHSFAFSLGGSPQAGLILSGDTLYGTTPSSTYAFLELGPWGTVFALKTDGTGFTNLFSFLGEPSNPQAGLVLSGATLYGTAAWGEPESYNSDWGSVFAVNTDGTGFTNLHTFIGGNTSSGPWGGLVGSSNTLYGTTLDLVGTQIGNTVFKVNTDGTGFTNLHSFGALSANSNTNTDGTAPLAALILSGNTLYGTTEIGGTSGQGMVFAVNTDGSGFKTLYNFTAHDGNYLLVGNDAFWPRPTSAALVLSGNTLYGTTEGDSQTGVGPYGSVFSLSFPPQLSILPSGTNVVLTWPTNYLGFDYSGYTLQSTTNLVPPAVWAGVSPAQVVVNGQNVVTNPITGTQQFYRLKQ
jgi:uncharacterized repeat protein (TIGR03803 family)